jgi:hypothetical protein
MKTILKTIAMLLVICGMQLLAADKQQVRKSHYAYDRVPNGMTYTVYDAHGNKVAEFRSGQKTNMSLHCIPMPCEYGPYIWHVCWKCYDWVTQTTPQSPYKHDVIVTSYSFHGIESVPPKTYVAGQGGKPTGAGKATTDGKPIPQGGSLLDKPTFGEKFKMNLPSGKSQKAQDSYAAPGSAPEGRPPTPVVRGQGKQGGTKNSGKVSPTPRPR